MTPRALRADPSGKRGGWYDCASAPANPAAWSTSWASSAGSSIGPPICSRVMCGSGPTTRAAAAVRSAGPGGATVSSRPRKPVAALARQKLPGAKIILSTWFFDEGEWQGLNKAFAAKKPLADYILAEGTTRPMPGKLPMVGFPEISMYETFPWGGFGATPLYPPRRAAMERRQAAHQRRLSLLRGHLRGHHQGRAGPTLLERPAGGGNRAGIRRLRYSPEVVDEMVKVVATLERNHHWRWWPGELKGVKLDLNWFPSRGAKPQADPGAEEAYATVRAIDAKLTPQARRSWRWRQLYLRALLDAELKANGGKPNDRCNEAFAELIKIYHAENASPAVRPPLP